MVLSPYNVLVFLLLLLIVPHQLEALRAKSQKQINTSMSALTEEQKSQFAKNSGLFALDLYGLLAADNPNKNIVFSPFSIQTCAAMARVGAEGETAVELDRGLHLIASDTTTIANSFHNVLAQYVDSNVLKIANKIYVMNGFTVRKDFNEIMNNQFFSSAESINFAQSDLAADNINAWVESKTNNLIKKLVSPSALDADTRLVLLNAIHFKGEWQHKFRKENTREEDFYLNESDKVKVPMMSLKERFRYADLPELDAKVLEMPYKQSDLSMLIILPNSRTGLKALEEKLKTVSLSDISNKMYNNQVIVKFPKFKAEFSLELNEPMKKLGMTRLFSNQAEFGKMLEETDSLKVSKVIHKAFIDVNEEGTEAAAATGMLFVTYSMPRMPELFTANKPFIYFIRNDVGSILFAGQTCTFP